MKVRGLRGFIVLPNIQGIDNPCILAVPKNRERKNVKLH